MTFADSNRASIRYIAESTANWGATPTSGKTRPLRFTSSTLGASKQTVVSSELRADRMVSSVPEVGATSEGDVNFELSAGSQDDFLQAFLLGAWTRPMSFDFFKGANVAFTANDTLTISGVDVTDYFVVGRRVKTEGFKTPANNGYRTISAVAVSGSDTALTFTETTATAEVGSGYTKVLDANDVIVLNSTALRLGTAGASTIDSNGGNAFASAIAAGQLVSGQKIFVDLPVGAVAFDNIAVTFSDTGADADAITVSDGLSIKDLVAGTDYATGADATTTGDNFAAAVNLLRAQYGFHLKASNAAGVVTVFSTDNNSAFAVTEKVDSTAAIAIAAKVAATAKDARGFFTVLSATDDVLTVSPTMPTVATPGNVNIKGSLLRNPGDVTEIVPQSFTIETEFNDVQKYFIQDGMRIGTYTLDVASGKIVTGSMKFQGKETKVLLASQLNDNVNYTPLDSTATEVLNATTNVGNLTKNGNELATAIQSLSISGDASLRNQNAVGSKFPRGIGTGRFNLTGKMTAYFETLDLYTDFLEHNTISIGFDFTDQDSNVYFYTIPALKITSDPVHPAGIDQDVVEEMDWSALRDPATSCMLQVDRFSSIIPV